MRAARSAGGPSVCFPGLCCSLVCAVIGSVLSCPGVRPGACGTCWASGPEGADWSEMVATWPCAGAGRRNRAVSNRPRPAPGQPRRASHRRRRPACLGIVLGPPAHHHPQRRRPAAAKLSYLGIVRHTRPPRRCPWWRSPSRARVQTWLPASSPPGRNSTHAGSGSRSSTSQKIRKRMLRPAGHCLLLLFRRASQREHDEHDQARTRNTACVSGVPCTTDSPSGLGHERSRPREAALPERPSV